MNQKHSARGRLCQRAMLPLVAALLLIVAVAPAQAQLPPCGERPMYSLALWVDPTYMCLEWVIDDPASGDLAYTALAVGDDGTLYATRPREGQIYALDDTNGDGLPDAPRVIAEGLTLPNALAWHDGALYIAGGGRVDRLVGSTLTTLIDDLPASAFWTVGLAVGDDGRIYVATGAPCDQCEPDDPAQGAVIIYEPDSGHRTIIAHGLRQPGDLAIYHNVLWTSDTAWDALEGSGQKDEINLVTRGLDFGFPACAGAADCPDGVALPAYTFPAQSSPLGMAAYHGDALPTLADTLLVVLSGNRNDSKIAGFMVTALRFDAQGAFTDRYDLMPNGDGYLGSERYTTDELSYRNSGFFPRRPLDVAVSPQGWVYVSVSGGRILALRPPGG
ncbi:MAG: PQQ-dependent sugar dehydrogenase [Anaerolineae bacterium]|nr:PQQ-dependent sugar dehydrogenase [Anaerolineae bacterium]